MKTLLVSTLFLFVAGSFISADFKNNDISRDNAFHKSLTRISSLESNIQSLNESELKEEFRRIANSIDVLKERYPDLNNPSTAGITVQNAVDKLASENNAMVHGDSCFREFVQSVFACFRGCTTHQALKACLSTACTNFQVCKDGGPRR